MAADRVHDLGAARAFFERDRPWSAWALASLSLRDWSDSALWVDGATGAGLWVYASPSWGGAVHTFGGGETLDALVRSVQLPRRAFVKATPSAREALEARYRFEWLDPIVRMAVTPGTFRPSGERLPAEPRSRESLPAESLPAELLPAEPLPTDLPPVESLGPRDADDLARLYVAWPESRFNVGRLRRGYWYEGIRMDGRVVAVAENAIRAPDEGVAVVQGVYVAPPWRGRGLARAVTAALTARLFRAGARDVVLDVRAENAAARAAYRRLGYREHAEFLGGPGQLRASFHAPTPSGCRARDGSHG